MITSHLLKRVLCKRGGKKRHCKALLFVGLATIVLVAVGHFLASEKTVEYGTLWLFEQFLGGAKAAVFGVEE